ncbi:hypothetical protein B0I37DRAFT_387838 [Chaetomium sp. MPI-CAGE-AT-0009]|nr:hypothetical protein B0I37DRAFT_387838 [Chaetomium sp. MPI-CAGE-AT-0009]
MPPELSRECPLPSATAPRPASLLSLPPYLRHFIYLRIDVARFDQHPYTYFLDGRRRNPPGMSDYDPPPSRNFMGLLLSCRAFYVEMTSLLYSANRFILFYTRKRTLQPLRALSPTSIAALTNLKIVLNESSCHEPVDARDYPPTCCCTDSRFRTHCAERHGNLHCPPLLDSLSGLSSTSTRLATQDMVTEWHNTATYLSSHATTGNLELWFEVTWCRRNRSYYIFAPPCLISEGGCPPHIHHGCPLIECTLYPDWKTSKGARRFHGCFCRRLHGAYTSACKCWLPPTPLFLINRLLCQDAQTVFFSGNRFVVHDFYAIPPQNHAYPALILPAHFPPDPIPTFEPPFEPTNERDYPHTRYAASEFLRDAIPPHCLTHLRFLEFLFPPYVPNDWPIERTALQHEWRETVEWASTRLNLPALAVRMVMSYPLVHPNVARRELTEEEGTRILKGYWRVASPLRELAKHHGMGAFWVQPAYPFRGEQQSIYYVVWKRYGEEWMEEKERALKEQYEHIPGRDGGAASGGKVEPLKGVWQRWYELDYY